MTKNKDEALYRRMLEPFKSSEEANAAVTAFFEDVRIAREKHKMTDVAVVVQGSYMDGEEEHGCMATSHNGDALKVESMYAYAYGMAQKERELLIGRMLKGK